MAGGDLRHALDRDMMKHGRRRRLGWYERGRVVLLCVARGLTYLHSERVRGGLAWAVHSAAPHLEAAKSTTALLTMTALLCRKLSSYVYMVQATHGDLVLARLGPCSLSIHLG